MMMMMMFILVSNVDANADNDGIAWQSKQPHACYTNIPAGTTKVGFEEDHNRQFDADYDHFDDDDDDDMVDMTFFGQVSIGDGYHKMRMRSNLFGLRLTLVSPIPRSSTSISAATKASRY